MPNTLQENQSPVEKREQQTFFYLVGSKEQQTFFSHPSRLLFVVTQAILHDIIEVQTINAP